MEKSATLSHEIRVRVADRQIEFLENRSKELGLSSKSELLRWYIVSDMVKTITTEYEKPKKKRISLEGITSGSTVTEADIEEVKKQWYPKLP